MLLQKPTYSNHERHSGKGLIHLSGSMDFKPSSNWTTVKSSLKNRAEETGGLVSVKEVKGTEVLEVYPSMSDQKFVLYKSDDKEKVGKIVTYDDNKEICDRTTVSELTG